MHVERPSEWQTRCSGSAERLRPVLLVQRTEPNILPAAGGPTLPVVLLEIVQQRQSPPECFEAFAHGAFFASGTQSASTPLRFPGKDRGRTDFFHRRRGQRTPRAEIIHGNGCTRVSSCLSRFSHWATQAMAWRRNETSG